MLDGVGIGGEGKEELGKGSTNVPIGVFGF